MTEEYVYDLVDRYVTKIVRKSFKKSAKQPIGAYLNGHHTYGGKRRADVIKDFLSMVGGIAPPIIAADFHDRKPALMLILRAVEAKRVCDGTVGVAAEVANAIYHDLPRITMEAALPAVEDESVAARLQKWRSRLQLAEEKVAYYESKLGGE